MNIGDNIDPPADEPASSDAADTEQADATEESAEPE